MWGTLISTALSVGSSIMAAKAQEKSAKLSADGVRRAQQISEARYQQMRYDSIVSYNDAMVSVFGGMQEGRDLILQGQASAQDILNQSYSGASQTLQTYGQQAINAMLGITGQPPTVENVQQAEQQLPAEQQTQPTATSQGAAQQTSTPVTEAGQPHIQPDGSVLFGGGNQMLTLDDSAGVTPQDQTGLPQDQTGVPQSQGGGKFAQPRQMMGDSQEDIRKMPGDTTKPGGSPYTPMENIRNVQEGDAYIVDPSINRSIIDPQGPLEGEFIPSNYNLPQTGLNLPSGQYGLAGAESALLAGSGKARQDLKLGTLMGLEGMGLELGFAGEEVRRGRDFGIGEMRSALSQGRGDITSGTDRGVASVMAGADRGVGFMQPYMQSGKAVQERMLALTGAMGPEAYNNAIMNDPEAAYNLSRGETALGRKAALTGGVGGGNITAEIEANARAEEAASTMRNFNRLFGISEAGRGAASTAGGFTTQAGITAGGMQAQGGRDLATMAMQGGRDISGIGERASTQIADLARIMGVTEMQAMQMLGQNLGETSMQTGQQLGDYRFNTGLNLQNALMNQGTQQANLQTSLGGNLTDLDQQTAINLANQTQEYGGAQADLQTGLASLLANAGVNQATQQVGLAQNLGNAQAAGVTNPIGNAMSSISGIMAANPNAFGFGNTPAPVSISPETRQLNYSQIPEMTYTGP